MELKGTGETLLRTGHKTILSLMQWVRLAGQPRENTDKCYYDVTTSDKEPWELISAWLGAPVHTTRWDPMDPRRMAGAD